MPASIIGSMGVSVEQPQWESGNTSVRFPFAEDISFADCPGYPFDSIVDACVVLPSEGSPSMEVVTVGCLHISRSMVSVMIYADDTPILHGVCLAAMFEPFTPVMLEPLRPGCSGCVSFGDIRFENVRTPIILKNKARLADSAILRPVVGRLRRFIQPERGEEATGIVGLEVPDGVILDHQDTGHVSLIGFSLTDAGRETVKVSCNPAEPAPTMSIPISSINGVHPDSQGRIAIVFARDRKEVPA